MRRLARMDSRQMSKKDKKEEIPSETEMISGGVESHAAPASGHGASGLRRQLSVTKTNGLCFPGMLAHSTAGFIGPQVSNGPQASTLNLHPFGILQLSQILPQPLLNDLAVVQMYGASIILIVYTY
ncbi:uncharacterized protein LOC111288605 [Durio zibethinus]|uniref:Uncharacterized protein LOC111288605 n=1 Tax=Durio zibethinus TaxID=66656 RepID=A0A6P5Y4C6_DURZI|nr:uncharacterized protein LOC111288605 [Durio zibethinus]